MLPITSGPRVGRRTPDDWVDIPYERFSVSPLTPTIGAELGDVDLRDVDDDLFAEIRRCLLEWKVIFFRDQHLERADQAALARRFGELETHPFFKHLGKAQPQPEDEPEVVRLAKGPAVAGYENVWHTDTSWRPCPAFGAVLRAIEVPGVGGDTLWADMGAAYDGLDDAVPRPDRRSAGRARLDRHLRVGDGSGYRPGAAGRLPGGGSPGGAHASRDRTAHLVRQP